MIMRGYPVHLRKDGEYITVSFPDIPEAHTFGNNREHALEMAKEALESALEFYFEDRRPVPEPLPLVRRLRARAGGPVRRPRSVQPLALP